jgi:mRNA interferase HigB
VSSSEDRDLYVIGRKKLQNAAKRLGEIEQRLEAWFQIAKAAEWRSLQDVRKTYSHADGVKVGDTSYTVFNIGGNKFRLIARIEYRSRTIVVEHILTHAEYDKGRWKL